MKSVCLALVLVLSLAPATRAVAGELETRDEKILYALGLSLSQSLRDFRLSDRELEALKQGLTDGTTGRPAKLALHVWKRRVEGLRQERIEQARQETRARGKAFVAEAASKPGAVRKPSGLIYTEVQPGSGPQPRKDDRVVVNYHGTRPDGSIFDTTRGKEPASFGLDEVIACWTEAVQLMKVGGKSKLVCPANLAYGDSGMPPLIAPGEALAFEIELLELD